MPRTLLARLLGVSPGELRAAEALGREVATLAASAGRTLGVVRAAGRARARAPLVLPVVEPSAVVEPSPVEWADILDPSGRVVGRVRVAR